VSEAFRGTVIDGHFRPDSPGEFKAVLAKLEGKDIAVRLVRFRESRTLSQNGYYWAVVVPMFAECCGYDDEEMHNALKMRFLMKHDGPMPTVRSTTSLDTKEFTDYIESCRRLAAEMGCVIPDPGTD
jgi:hypothetical protein